MPCWLEDFLMYWGLFWVFIGGLMLGVYLFNAIF